MRITPSLGSGGVAFVPLRGAAASPEYDSAAPRHLCLTRTHTGTRHYGRVRRTFVAAYRATAVQLVTIQREHGHIENKLYCICDLTRRIYASTVRIADAAHDLATLRNLAPGLL